MSILRTIFLAQPEPRLRLIWRFLSWAALIMFLSILVNGALALFPAFREKASANAVVPYLFNNCVILLTLAAACIWIDRRPLANFGFDLGRPWWRDFGVGLLMGVLLMGGIFLTELAFGWLKIDGWLVAAHPTPDTVGNDIPASGNVWVDILLALLFFVMVGLLEETLFRAYLTKNLAESLRFLPIPRQWVTAVALVLTSVVFGLAHGGNPNASWVSNLNIILAGVVLGLGYVWTGRLALPIGFHITWNFFQGNVFGFPVSGTNAGATLLHIQQGGPLFWTGGAFGPEAGFLTIISLLVAVAVLAYYARHKTAALTAIADYPSTQG